MKPKKLYVVQGGAARRDEKIGPELPAAVKKDRICLRCRKTFSSWGAANRLCANCLEYANEEMCGTAETITGSESR